MNSDINTILTNFVEDLTSLIHFDVEVYGQLLPGYTCESDFYKQLLSIQLWLRHVHVCFQRITLTMNAGELTNFFCVQHRRGVVHHKAAASRVLHWKGNLQEEYPRDRMTYPCAEYIASGHAAQLIKQMQLWHPCPSWRPVEKGVRSVCLPGRSLNAPSAIHALESPLVHPSSVHPCAALFSHPAGMHFLRTTP